MVLKLVDATQLRPGHIFMCDNEPLTVRSNDISKSGKHGASKCRIEAIAVFTGKKNILAIPGSERFDVPNVEKIKYQILSVEGDRVSAMDLESYETIDLPMNEELREQIKPEAKVEVWDIEGKRAIMRII